MNAERKWQNPAKIYNRRSYQKYVCNTKHEKYIQMGFDWYTCVTFRGIQVPREHFIH